MWHRPLERLDVSSLPVAPVEVMQVGSYIFLEFHLRNWYVFANYVLMSQILFVLPALPDLHSSWNSFLICVIWSLCLWTFPFSRYWSYADFLFLGHCFVASDVELDLFRRVYRSMANRKQMWPPWSASGHQTNSKVSICFPYLLTWVDTLVESIFGWISGIFCWKIPEMVKFSN